MTRLSIRELIDQATSNDLFLILGYGVTGRAVARFLDRRGLKYFVFDDAPSVTCEGTGCQGRFHFEGTLQTKTAKSFSAIFPTPGLDPKHPVVQAAHKQSIPLIGELELAAQFLSGQLIGVTGTNGKSTTVKLIHELLMNAGLSSSLKGNIGSPLIDAVHEEPASIYVVEESSFQLEQIESLHHAIAICLNVTDDHYERYKDIQDYAEAKARILKNSTAQDVFIFNADDIHCVHMSQKTSARLFPVSLVHSMPEGGSVEGETMVVRLKGREFRFETKECALKGYHNIENMLVSLIAVLLLHSDEPAVQSYRQTLKTFEGLAHRLQKVHTANGVNFYDDSKATNVGAVVMALAGFEKNVILIAGGRDKMGDYAPLKGLVQHKVKRLILLGEAKEVIQQALKGASPLECVRDMSEAVHRAVQIAAPGDTVLLSPACSSYDQYKNYKERGEDFVSCVLKECTTS